MYFSIVLLVIFFSSPPAICIFNVKKLESVVSVLYTDVCLCVHVS